MPAPATDGLTAPTASSSSELVGEPATTGRESLFSNAFPDRPAALAVPDAGSMTPLGLASAYTKSLSIVHKGNGYALSSHFVFTNTGASGDEYALDFYWLNGQYYTGDGTFYLDPGHSKGYDMANAPFGGPFVGDVVISGDEPVEASITTPNYGIISGVIYESDGITPLLVPSIGASRQSDGWWFGHTYNLSDGSYYLGGLPDDDYLVYAQASYPYGSQWYDGHVYQHEADTVTVSGASQAAADFIMGPGGQITGTVFNAAGSAPLADINVDVDIGGFGTCTGENGQYILEGLPFGVDYAVVAGQGWNWCLNQEATHAFEYYLDTRDYNNATLLSPSEGNNTFSNIDFTLEPAGTISGTVLNADGSAPLADINVDVEGGGYGACTDEFGRYTIHGLPYGDHLVFAGGDWNWCLDQNSSYITEYYLNVDDVGSATPINLSDTSEDVGGIDFTLSTAGIITGHVTGYDGPALEGVRVNVYEYNSGDHWGEFLTVAGGYYETHGLPTGDYKVAVDDNNTIPDGYSYQYYNDTPNWDEATPVPVDPDTTVTGIDFHLPPGGTISGVVRDSGGVPIPNLNVNANDLDIGGGWGTCTNEFGQFTVPGLQYGNYGMAAGGGWNWCLDEPGIYAQQYYDHTTDWDLVTPITLDAGNDAVTGIDFDLELGGTISGRVFDSETGLPVSNINLHMEMVDVNFGEGNCTDEDGYFTYNALPYGDYVAQAGGGWNWCQDQPSFYAQQYYTNTYNYDDATVLGLSAGNPDIANIDFNLEQGGTISGVVSNSDSSQTLANINVDIENGGYGTCTDDFGLYTMSGLPPGDYKVHAGGDWNYCVDQNSLYIREYWQEAPDAGSADSLTVASGSYDHSDIDFTLSTAGIITGQVTGHDGPVLEGVVVSISDYDSGEHWGNFWTDAGGFYETTGLPTSDYRVEVTYSDYIPDGYSYQYYPDTADWNEAGRVSVTPETTVTDIDFHLPPGGTISGLVRDSFGDPIPNLRVSVNDWDYGYGWAVCTDVNGAYTVHALPYATYTAQAGGGWNDCLDQPGIYGSQYYDHTIDWDLVTPITLDAGNDAVTGIDFDLELGGTISGRVLDAETGLPVSNINLHMEMVGVNFGEGNCTDEDGYFTYHALPYGDYVAQAGGGWNWCQDLPGNYSTQYYDHTYNYDDATILSLSVGNPDIVDINFDLEQDGTISGVVSNSDDSQPLANINVDIENGGYGTCTDENGLYTIISLPPGDYKVQAGGDWNWCVEQNSMYIREYWQETPDAGSAVILTVASGSYDHTNIDFTLSTAGIITGQVTGYDGPALEGVRVNVYEYHSGEHWGEFWTDATGYYETHGLPAGDYKVAVDDNNTIPAGYSYQYYDGTSDWNQATPVPVAPETTVTDIDFQLPPGGTISGVVLDGNGDPIPNLNVSANDLDIGGGWGNCTDEFGQFTVRGLQYANYGMAASGGWNWCLDEPGLYAQQYYDHTIDWDLVTPITLDAGNDAVIGIDFDLELGGTISGRVLDADTGLPVSNTNVSINMVDANYGEGSCTDEDGYFTYYALPYGDYVAQAGGGWNHCQDLPGYYSRQYYDHTYNYDDATVLGLSVGNPDIANIDFNLEQGGTISGVVTNSDGSQTLDNINVDIENGGYGTCSDENGLYTISGLPPGDYKVQAGGDWNWCVEQNSLYIREYWQETPDAGSADILVVASGSYDHTNIDFTLSTAGIITGQVTGYDGPALEGVRVNVYEYHSGEHWGEFWTDATGYYETHGLPSGDYKVAVDDNNTIPAGYSYQYYDGTSDWNQATPVPVAPETTVTGIDFHLPPGGTISGVVRDSGGVPIPNLNVNANDLDIGGGWGTCTDEFGQFTVRGLQYGNYGMEAGGGWNWCLDEPGIYARQYYSHTVDWDQITTITLDSGNDAVTGVDFDLDIGGTITGRVYDAESGQPASNINLDAGMVNVNYGEGSCSDDQGYFTFNALPYGDYVASASGGWNWCQDQPSYYAQQYYTNTYNYDDAIVLNLTVGTPDIANIDFNLEQGGTISGIVTNSDGSQTLANINVDVENGGYGTCTDENGQYTISGLPPGDYKANAGGDWNFCQDQNSVYIREYWEETPEAGSAEVLVVGGGVYTYTGIDFTLSQGGQISGRVTAAADGSPLEGVRVDVEDYDSSEYQGDGFSDVDGYYTISGLQTGDYMVRVNDEDHIPPGYAYQIYPDTLFYDDAARVPVEVKQNTADIDFHLEPGGSISGQVRDEGGVPLANINLHSSIRVSEDDRQSGRGACSDENGFYTVSALPYASHDIEAGGSWNWCLDEPGTYTRESYDNVYDWRDATLIDIDETHTDYANIDFDLAPGFIITGLVTDADSGQPLANIHIGAHLMDDNFGEGACTDENGIYGFYALPAGEYRIDAGQDRNWCTEGVSPYIREYYDNVYNRDEATPVPLDGGTSPVTDINFAMDTGGSISGRVIDEEGSPLANIRIEAQVNRWGDCPWCWDNLADTQTEADGSYLLSTLPPGEVVIYACVDCNRPDLLLVSEYYINAYSPEMATPVPVVDGQTTSDIDFELGQGVLITGTVTVPPGYSEEGIRIDAWINEGWWYGTETETDSGGNYIVAVPPSYDSRWTVSVRPQGTDLGFQWANDFYLDDQTQWDFDLGPGGSISGTITDGGQPVANAHVQADSKWMNEGADTDENGDYEITNLPPGSYQMRADQWPDRQEAFYHGYDWNTNKPVTLKEDGTITDIDFELPETGLITGTVYDMDGSTTIEGAQIMAMNDSARWQAWSQPDGRFYLDAPAGEYKLVIHPADWEKNVYGYYLDGGWSYTYRDATPVIVPPVSGGSVTVTINIPQRATLSGTVHDSVSGLGVGGIHVATLTDYESVGIEHSNATCTDENGDYSIERIFPGKAEVIAVGTCGASEYSTVVTATFTAVPGGNHNLDLVMTAGPIPERAFTIKTEQSFDLTPISSGASIGVAETDQILPALFAPLVQLDDQGQWYSELLTQVPTTANGGAAIVDGRLQVTYELLPDLVWSDDHPLTSGDIRFAWEKMVQPRIFQDDYWTYYGAAWKIERVETPDLLTAVLVYKHSQIPSDYLGAIPYPMPEHILGGEHATDIQHFSEYAHNPVGNGPYVVFDFVPGSHLDLVANPKYHKRDLDGGYPRINNVRFLFQNHPFWSVASGQADVSINVGDHLPGDYETYDLDFHSSSAVWFQVLVPDTRLPFFAETTVRQALYYAMDRESWAEPYLTRVEGHSYLPPDHPLYSDTITTYDFDLALAGSMLDAAGWVDSNADGIRDKDGVEFSFDLVYNEGNESRMSLLTRFQEDLASIGVDSNVISVPWQELLENTRYGRYDAYALGWGFDSRTDPNAYGLFASRSIPTGYNRYQGSRYTGYWSNAANDALLEAMINELDGGVLADLYAQQTALLSEELPTWPYGWSPQYDVTTPILENFQSNQMTPATWNMEHWYVPDNPYDMSVRKTLAPDSPAPQPGVTITYEVNVQNSGYYTMENVTLMDTLPAEVVYDSATPPPSSIVDDKLYWDLGDIAGYQPYGPIFVSVTIPEAVEHDTVISNRVQVWADQTDTNPDNDAFVYQVTVRDDVDLAVNKSGVGQPAIGAVYDYTIDYYNLGGAPAAGVILTDTLPAEVTLVAANPPPDLTAGQTLTWSLPQLEGNQWGGQIELTTTIDSAGTFTNTARIDYDGPETDFDNNVDDHPEEVNEILAPIIIQPTQGVADGTPLVVAGQAPAGATVFIYNVDVPGDPELGNTVAGTNGEFSLELTLPEGGYIIQAKAKKDGLTSGYSNASTFSVNHSLLLDTDLVSLTSGEAIISKGVVRAQLRTLQARVLNVQAPVHCSIQPTAELRVTENGLFTYYIPPVSLTAQGGNVWLFDTNLWMSEIHSTYDIWLKWNCDGTPGEESLGFILIDPDGYLYDQAMVDAGSTITDSLILNGVITAYVWLEDTWQIWPANIYDGQFNPQYTDPNVEDGVREPGYYSFLTPPGQFRIEANAPGYQPYQSPILTVINTPIRHDIGLQPIQGGEGVTLSPANLSESHKRVEPQQAWLGDILTYTISLVNSGEEDTGMLTLTDTIPADTIYVNGSVNTGESGATFLDEAIHWLGVVPAGEEVHISFQVEVIYTPGEPFNVNNLADVSGLPENVNSLSELRAVSTIQNQVGVAMSADGSENGNPGQNVVHNLSVENTGNFTDTYSFSYSSSVEWPVIMPDPITLGEGESASVPVTVTVPPEAVAGATDVVTITVRSQDYTSYSDDVTRITTVNQVAGVDFYADGTESDYPGSSVAFSHTLKNSGNGEDTFSFTYTSSEGWTVAVPGPVTLASGDSQMVEVLVSVPSGALPGVIDETTVTVTSSFDDSVTAQVTDQTAVNNSPPTFDSNPITKANATTGVAYNGSIENDATDPDGHTLTFSKVSGPAWLAIAPGGALSGTPSSSDVGVNSWTVEVDDGSGGTDQTTLKITVISGNVPPAFDSDPVVKPDATVSAPYSGTLAGAATDPNGDTLTFTKVSGPAWLTIAPDGALSGTPSSSDVGANSWTVEVSDGKGGTDQADLNITVVSGNAPPTFTSDPVVKPDATVSAPYSGTLAGDATDPNGDQLTFSIVSGPAWLTVAPDGALSGTPSSSDVGANSWTVEVSDGKGGTDQAALQITVTKQFLFLPIIVAP